jgi:hypothetical protein
MDDLEYHRERAARELDIGLVAETMTVARAHLKLAALHMSRVEELARSHADAKAPLSM